VQPIRLVKHDIFQHLPQVPAAEELVVSALKRANRVQATKGIQNAAKRAKNQAAKQLDALTKVTNLCK
jgi:nucleolar GTP-binding protein